MHLENQVGALPDQLNVCLLTNISIISQFVFEEVSFGLMIGVLFSFKSGLLLVLRDQLISPDVYSFMSKVLQKLNFISNISLNLAIF